MATGAFRFLAGAGLVLSSTLSSQDRRAVWTQEFYFSTSRSGQALWARWIHRANHRKEQNRHNFNGEKDRSSIYGRPN